MSAKNPQTHPSSTSTSSAPSGPSPTRGVVIPTMSTQYAQTGQSAKNNALGMRPMQERAYEKRGEQYLLIKSPPASGKSRALMFVALDKVHRDRKSTRLNSSH